MFSCLHWNSVINIYKIQHLLLDFFNVLTSLSGSWEDPDSCRLSAFFSSSCRGRRQRWKCKETKTDFIYYLTGKCSFNIDELMILLLFFFLNHRKLLRDQGWGACMTVLSVEVLLLICICSIYRHVLTRHV